MLIADDLDDPRLVWLARRLIYVERPHLLAPEHHAAMAAEKAGRMMADAADSRGWTTLARAADDLGAMLPSMDADAAAPFIRLHAYIELQTAVAQGIFGAAR